MNSTKSVQTYNIKGSNFSRFPDLNSRLTWKDLLYDKGSSVVGRLDVVKGRRGQAGGGVVKGWRGQAEGCMMRSKGGGDKLGCMRWSKGGEDKLKGV